MSRPVLARRNGRIHLPGPDGRTACGARARHQASWADDLDCRACVSLRDRASVVYLLHFDQPYEHARHYLGYSDHLSSRLRYHASGQGSRLLAAVSGAGGGWRVSRVWLPGSRTLERRIKNGGGLARVCPVCCAASGAEPRRYAA